jgi:hypothetical protein
MPQPEKITPTSGQGEQGEEDLPSKKIFWAGGRLVYIMPQEGVEYPIENKITIRNGRGEEIYASGRPLDEPNDQP